MDYPKNRLIVNGVDLTEKFKMVLSDGYTLTPPAIKTYTVDIPGGHGKLDLTEALFGDVAFDNRQQEFKFYIVDVDNFERVKTEVSALLHGRVYDYKLTMDPEYTYHGRFTINSYSHTPYVSGNLGEINISIDGDPFKYKETQVHRISCVGGDTFRFMSGRKSVSPTIETSGLLKVIYDGKLIVLPQGSWKINDIVFKSGANDIYFNSFDIHNLTWGELRDTPVTWGQFKEKKLYEWYKAENDGNIVFTTWSKIADKTWADYSESAWKDLVYMYEQIKDVEDSYIKYEWGDL